MCENQCTSFFNLPCFLLFRCTDKIRNFFLILVLPIIIILVVVGGLFTGVFSLPCVLRVLGCITGIYLIIVIVRYFRNKKKKEEEKKEAEKKAKEEVSKQIKEKSYPYPPFNPQMFYNCPSPSPGKLECSPYVYPPTTEKQMLDCPEM